MPLTRAGLTIETKISEKCTKLTVEDITGNYNVTSNPLGYGLPGGIVKNDITTIVIDVFYPNITTPITYTFTLVAGTPTALTVKNLNLVSFNIFADIATLYIDGVFNLTGQTAFTLPTLTDGIINVEYTVSGVSASEAFNYTTNKSGLSTCSVECCIEGMYKDLSACGCSESAIDKIEMVEVNLAVAKFAIDCGKDEKAQCFLDKASVACSGNCSDC